MSKKVLVIISLHIILLSILIPNLIGISKSQKIQATTTGLPTNMPAIYVEPSTISASPGETFNVSVRIFNLTNSFWQTETKWLSGDDLGPWSEFPLYNYSLGNLLGLDIQLGWDETVLKFVSNVTKIPVEIHPDGILHQPIFKIKDEVNETHGFPWPQPEESKYWLAYASFLRQYFNGNGTICKLTFEVLKEGASNLTLTRTTLGDADGNEIPHKFFSAFFRSPSSGPIYIRADGSIDPPSANIASADNITYYFTDNNYAEISVLRSNIVLDGNGFCLQGTNLSRGVDISHWLWMAKEIQDLPYGNWKTSAHFDEGEKLFVFFRGPQIGAMPCTIRVNITDPSGSNTTFRVDFSRTNVNITLELAGDGLLVGEPPLEGVMGSAGYDGDYIATVYTSNLTSAESCYPPNGVLPYLKLYGVAFGENITIKNMTIKDFDYGVYLEAPRNQIVGNRMINNNNAVYVGPSSLNNTITGNTITANNDNGIDLSSSSSNRISGNNITANNGYGIRLASYSNYNSIQGNNIAANNDWGIYLDSSSDCSISGNTITNNDDGIVLSSSSNSTVSGNTITNNGYGIRLASSSNSTVSGNNITANNWDGIVIVSSLSSSIQGNNIANNWDGISIGLSSNSSIQGNNITANGGYGIVLGSSSNSSIQGNNIAANNYYGIELYYSSNNSISGNTITNNYYGIYLDSSSDCSISGNNIANNDDGIWLDSSSDCSISGNTITNNDHGVWFPSSSNSSIQGNTITANDGYGIVLYSSSNYNSIQGNTITNSGYGIRLISSSSNRIFHNNLINNTNQLYSINSVNIWDDGYPSGGNYWSNYTGVDSDLDGIGDSQHVIDANNQDNYPLMGMFSSFNIALEYEMQTISNSTVSDPSYNGIAIFFDVTGENSTTGFCRLTIPTALMNGTYRVFVNRTEVSPTILPVSNSTHSYIYFTYTHSTKEVVIIPEFPVFLILPLFMIVTLLAGIIYRRKRQSPLP